MILDAAWAPASASAVFATAGRDKLVKIWREGPEGFTCNATIPEENPVTAIDFFDAMVGNDVYLAVGTDAGRFRVYRVTVGAEITVTEVLLEIKYGSLFVHSSIASAFFIAFYSTTFLS